MRLLRDLGIGLAAVAVLSFFVLAVSTGRVDGQSMEPTLRGGEALLVDRVWVRIHLPARGDIVLAQMPDGLTVVKRVIAVPGDTIEIDSGAGDPGSPALHHPEVLLRPGGNGPWQRLVEPYVGYRWTGLYYCCNSQGRDAGLAPAAFTLPPEQYFLMGDNRDVSDDSRVFGTFPADRIAGRVVARYWPLDHAGLLTASGVRMNPK